MTPSPLAAALRAQLDGDLGALRRARASAKASRARVAARRRPDSDPPNGIYPKEPAPMPVPVTASAPLPVSAVAACATSTLPEEGLDLPAEIARYQAWLVDQALIRTNGNRAGAARLLGINRTTLVEMLRRETGGTLRSRRRRCAQIRELRDARRAAGQCWHCGAALDGPDARYGSHAGLPHGRCESCREQRRGARSGTLNAHLKNAPR